MNIVEKRRSDVPGLPPGWKKEEIVRKTGLSAGKTDIYYFRYAWYIFSLSSVDTVPSNHDHGCMVF